MPDLSALAGMLGGGAGGGGGGMPDLASMMQNPQIMAMANQFMQSGGMDRMMQNPMFQNMVRLLSCVVGAPTNMPVSCDELFSATMSSGS